MGAGVGIIGGMGASMPTGALPGGAGSHARYAGWGVGGGRDAGERGGAPQVLAPQPFGGGAGWPGVTQQWPAYGPGTRIRAGRIRLPSPAYPAAPTAAQGYPQYGQQFSTSQQSPAPDGVSLSHTTDARTGTKPRNPCTDRIRARMLALSAVAERGMAGPTDLAQAFGDPCPPGRASWQNSPRWGSSASTGKSTS